MASIPVVSRSLIWPPFLLRRWSSSTNITPSRFFHSHRSHASSSSPHHLPLSRSLCAMTTPQDPSPPTKTERAVIKGRVQGVFYRNWTVENATQLGLKGWVRNRRDGSVEALFSGTSDAVHEMERRCRRGPPEAVVTGFEVFPASGDDDDIGAGFQRRPTV